MSRTLRFVVLSLLGVGLLGSVALAAANPPKGGGGYGYGYTPCKPGNGFGDKNHCHRGPPGQLKKHGKKKVHGQSADATSSTTEAVQNHDSATAPATAQNEPTTSETPTTGAPRTGARKATASASTTEAPQGTTAPSHGSRKGNGHGSSSGHGHGHGKG